MKEQEIRSLYEAYQQVYKTSEVSEEVETVDEGVNNEEIDFFDTILEYLVAEGFADTEEAATAIMANMSEEWKQSICEGRLRERPRGLPVGPVGKGFRELTIRQRKKMLNRESELTRDAMNNGQEYSGSHAAASTIGAALRSKRLGGHG